MPPVMALPVVVASPELLPMAVTLAAERGWLSPELLTDRKRDLARLVAAGHAVALLVDAGGLALQPLEHPLPGPVRVDFTSEAMGWRTRGGGGGEAVARACGVRAGHPLRVLDATAGLGRDAWLLAHVGATVTLCERSPVIHALLADGLARAAREQVCAATVARMTLHEGSSLSLLQTLAMLPAEARPETVYLDPMFPHREKSALVKIDMRVFRSVVGEDADADALLAAARAVATRRVVVKRPKQAPDLAGLPPHQRMVGQSSRFDLYAPVTA